MTAMTDHSAMLAWLFHQTSSGVVKRMGRVACLRKARFLLVWNGAAVSRRCHSNPMLLSAYGVPVALVAPQPAIRTKPYFCTVEHLRCPSRFG
jgi:hypothetical protein